ncbi:MAG: hypothetical protein H7228_17120 [Polaromonas sp.]|nr:hypothetical protein [Polaromonas sp.]
MHVALLRATGDAAGLVSGLCIKSPDHAISPRWVKRVMPALTATVDMADKTTSEGQFDLPYASAHQKIPHVAAHSAVSVGFWRSVGHSHNAFFSESVIDELAIGTGLDALSFRRALLKDAPRHLAVLELAARKAGWGRSLTAGRARGIALHQ